jgi:hypothetical protein
MKPKIKGRPSGTLVPPGPDQHLIGVAPANVTAAATAAARHARVPSPATAHGAEHARHHTSRQTQS